MKELMINTKLLSVFNQFPSPRVRFLCLLHLLFTKIATTTAHTPTVSVVSAILLRCCLQQFLGSFVENVACNNVVCNIVASMLLRVCRP